MEEIIEYFKERLKVRKKTMEDFQKETAKLEKFIAELERNISNPPA